LSCGTERRGTLRYNENGAVNNSEDNEKEGFDKELEKER
jgi:hypothetical protein